MTNVNMKRCSGCKLDKSVSEFYPNSHRKDGLQTRCKECSRANSKSRYVEEKDKLGPQIKAARRLRIKRNMEFVWDYLASHGCIDCGLKNPIMLEFDHVRGTKYKNVSTMIHSESSVELLKSEIEKCEVRCANCHRLKTSIQFNWYAMLKHEE